MRGVIYKCEQKQASLAPGLHLMGIWISGLTLGLAFSFLCRDYLTSLVPLFSLRTDSAQLKLFLLILPFLLSVITVYCAHPAWLFLICGMKAFSFSLRSFLLCLCYGQAGWLAYGLFMFFEIWTLPCLYFYWLHCLNSKGDYRWYMHIILLLFIAIIAIIDYRIVTPYAVQFGFI